MRYTVSPFFRQATDPFAVAHDSQLRELLKAGGRFAPDEVVIDEFCLPGGLVRADVVAVGGVLTGYEIKAGKDKLSRLPGQVQAYGAVFEQCNLVTVAEHINEANWIVPEWWGLVIAVGNGRNVRLEQLRPAKANLQRDPRVLSEMLWRAESLARLEALGVRRGIKCKSRSALAQMLASALTLSQLDAYVRSCLRVRRLQHDRPDLGTALTLSLTQFA